MQKQKICRYVSRGEDRLCGACMETCRLAQSVKDSDKIRWSLLEQKKNSVDTRE